MPEISGELMIDPTPCVEQHELVASMLDRLEASITQSAYYGSRARVCHRGHLIDTVAGLGKQLGPELRHDLSVKVEAGHRSTARCGSEGWKLRRRRPVSTSVVRICGFSENRSWPEPTVDHSPIDI